MRQAFGFIPFDDPAYRHVTDAEVLSDGLIDLNKIKPLARLGYQQYTAVDNVFVMVRPQN